jgi:hypothetical protein
MAQFGSSDIMHGCTMLQVEATGIEEEEEDDDEEEKDH